MGLPAWYRSPPVNAGDTSSIPSMGIPHATEQLSPWITTTEACAPRTCTLQREATATRNTHTATKSSLHSLQLEKAPCNKEDLA